MAEGIDTVTGEMVKEAMISGNIMMVNHHPCGCCNEMVYYYRENDQLFFDPTCGCPGSYTRPEPRSWDEAADWINMQSRADSAIMIAKSFGLDLV